MFLLFISHAVVLNNLSSFINQLLYDEDLFLNSKTKAVTLKQYDKACSPCRGTKLLLHTHIDFKALHFPFLFCTVFLTERNKICQLWHLNKNSLLNWIDWTTRTYSDILEHFETPGIKNKVPAVEPSRYNDVPLFSVFHCSTFGH